jgi:DNA-binding NtrC family response regulator
LIRKRILVVDDDESLRWVTQAQLQQSGYEASAAASGREALDRVREDPPDLVITDLMMPGMSGLDLLKRIRAEYPEVIVIMVTAFGAVDTAVEAMKAGAYDYPTKPVNVDELRITVGVRCHGCRGLATLLVRWYSAIGQSHALAGNSHNGCCACHCQDGLETMGV